MKWFPLPILGSTTLQTFRLILRAIRVATDGTVGIAGYRGDGTTLQALSSQIFTPVAGGGQVIAFAAVAVNSALLTGNRAHWVFCEDDSCWIRVSDGTPAQAAAAGDFPLPVGAIAEYTPGPGEVLSVIQRGGPGNLVIGESEAF